eukprot:5141430-Pleurochrysis_carterae.AAC.1
MAAEAAAARREQGNESMSTGQYEAVSTLFAATRLKMGTVRCWDSQDDKGFAFSGSCVCATAENLTERMPGFTWILRHLSALLLWTAGSTSLLSSTFSYAERSSA